jgi:phosphate/sulfate permease
LETLYLIIVIVLFLLAASDLIVGVSNDAVNFLNSAVGSKAASFKVIMVVASLGILFGSVFSSGMMEVARKGIFHPEMFYFHEIMLLFLAVMVADVILLDTFNTLGMPTSTTVSIVFELLGAAVGMASIKIMGDDPGKLGEYINSGKALAIISGILVSVVIAFAVGAIIQYLVRLVFSFNYHKRVKYIGATWGGIALTAITYFLLIKGIKNVSFIHDDLRMWISENTTQLMIYSFVGWTVLLQLLFLLFKFNILRFTVLVGTFGLAMAFAGNDLVNFIGVPIAGYNSYEFWVSSGANPDTYPMTDLAGKVPTPTLFLVIAGIIMILTLYFSKKAKTVIKTSIDLSRQNEGDERFKSTWFSKVLVRSGIKTSENLKKVVPRSIQAAIKKQFKPYTPEKTDDTPPAFDLIRASVNLVVASILIAIGTSLKLPLSTTYVTFMVAMGTSLSDNAWDRENAVYRISGMFAVIGGWFLTAMAAFTLSFIIIYIFNYLSYLGILLMIAFSIYLVYKSHKYHKKVTEDNEEKRLLDYTDENIFEKSVQTILVSLETVLKTYEKVVAGLKNEDIKSLKNTNKAVGEMTEKVKYVKDHINVIVDKLREDSIESGYYFVQVIDYLREMVHSIEYIVKPALNHVDNNHKPLINQQIEELNMILEKLELLISAVSESIKNNDFSNQDITIQLLEDYRSTIEQIRKNQIKRVKNNIVGTKNSILYFDIINESKNLGFQIINLYKSQRDFVIYRNNNLK